MASGTIDSVAPGRRHQLRDPAGAVLHAGARCPGCTDKNRLFADTNANRPVALAARHDQELSGAQGLRRVLRLRALEHGEDDRRDRRPARSRRRRRSPRPSGTRRSTRPSRPWTSAARSTRAAATYTCRVEVAPGSEPNNGRTTDIPPGDFKTVSSGWCNGCEPHELRSAACSRPRPERPQVALPGDGRLLQRSRADPGSAELQQPPEPGAVRVRRAAWS